MELNEKNENITMNNNKKCMRGIKTISTIFLTTLLVSPEIFGQSSYQGRVLNNATDSSQYVLGLYFARYLEANNLEITDSNLFNMGLNDGTKGSATLIESDSITSLMTSMIFNATKEANSKAEKELFDGLRLQGMDMTSGGVFYTVRKVGSGITPALNDSVIINYKGYLPKGTLFQDSYAANSPLRSTPEELIEGMKEAIQLMPEGSTWRMYIPSALAYGETGIAGLIPIYSAVIFDVELVQVKPARRSRANRNR
jgi:FKBP-type peptidyl-prolyl cis-trans isomerase